MSNGTKRDRGKGDGGTWSYLSAIPPGQRGWTPTVDQKRREDEILAKERALASGKLLVDGYPIKMLTPEEAQQRFGESENDLIISVMLRETSNIGGRSPKRQS